VTRRERPVERRPDVQSVPSVELACNPSAFAVYSGVRQSVLASFVHRLTATLCHSDVDSHDDNDDNDEETAAGRSCSDPAVSRLPKVSFSSVQYK